MLRGFTIGITADRRWEEQASLFERRGAFVQHGPSIRSLAHGSDTHLRSATDAVIARRPVALIANTGVGIRSWFSAAETWGIGEELTAALETARIYARGPKASGAVHSYGLAIEARAVTERLSEAVDLALPALRPGDVVAVQLDGSGNRDETTRLRDAGAHVIAVPVYEWTLPADHLPSVRLAEAAIAGKVHAVTFTSGPALRNWMSLATEYGLDAPLREALTDGRIVVGCVGPVCAESAAEEGLHSPYLVVPAKWRLGPLVRAVAERLAERALSVDVGGATMVVAGTVATVGDTPIVLTDTEAQVLALLAAKPNVVHAKADLLRLVWRDEDADPHVVETVIARLRRRLGPIGAHITSVYRRGYLLRTD